VNLILIIHEGQEINSTVQRFWAPDLLLTNLSKMLFSYLASSVPVSPYSRYMRCPLMCPQISSKNLLSSLRVLEGQSNEIKVIPVFYATN
jgi:hypothetical protein